MNAVTNTSLNTGPNLNNYVNNLNLSNNFDNNSIYVDELCKKIKEQRMIFESLKNDIHMYICKRENIGLNSDTWMTGQRISRTEVMSLLSPQVMTDEEKAILEGIMNDLYNMQNNSISESFVSEQDSGNGKDKVLVKRDGNHSYADAYDESGQLKGVGYTNIFPSNEGSSSGWTNNKSSWPS